MGAGEGRGRRRKVVGGRGGGVEGGLAEEGEVMEGEGQEGEGYRVRHGGEEA